MTERTALVTGGASGIGRAVCLALAADERRVAVADINASGANETVEMVRTRGGEALAVAMDITDSDSVTHGCTAVEAELGPVASDAGRVGSSLEAAYSGAKGATIAFSKTPAREVATKGVTVNVVCPGPTETALLQEIVDDNSDSDRVISAMKNAVAMKRLGQPEEVAPAVVYFASENAGYPTGQTLSVSGGLTMAG